MERPHTLHNQIRNRQNAAHCGFLWLFLILIIPHPLEAQWIQLVNPGDRGAVGALVSIDTNIFTEVYDDGGGINGGPPSHVAIFRSSDYGTNWIEVDSGLSFEQPWYLVTDGPDLFAIADDSTSRGVFVSTDLGANWRNTITNNYLGQLFVWQGKILAFTGGAALFSSDTGKSWTDRDSPPIIGGFGHIGSQLFIGGDGIYRSTNDGISWISIDNGLPGFPDSLPSIGAFSTIGTRILAGGGYGRQPTLFVSSDSGANWASVASSALPMNAEITALAESGNNLFAGTTKGVFLTTDMGLSWRSVSEGMSDTALLSLFVKDTLLFAVAAKSNRLSFLGERHAWRRPLSEMIPSSAVTQPKLAALEISSYPNPVTNSTTINFTATESGPAEVTIVNLLGTEVTRLYSGELAQGPHSFTWDSGGMAPGMYACLVRMNGTVQQTPLVLMR